MEKKTTQRIIGILVVITLVVILLPLLFGKNDITLQSTSNKAPPFPNQEPAAATDVATHPDSASMDTNAELAPDLSQNTHATPQAPSNTTAQSDASHPVDATPNAENLPLAMTPIPNLGQSEEAKPKSEESAAKTAESASDKTTVSKLKTTSWVIQMGYFKDKNNARRLADKLRASGYKAFMRDAKSTKGVRTRVLIGPESKQALAVKLSTKVAQEFKMHGIVMTFKPLDI